MNKSKLLEMHDDVTYWIRSNIITPIRRVYESIINMYEWMPVICSDRHWDYVYLLIIMKKKLELMEKSFTGEYAVAMYSKDRAKEMKECINILNRLIKDDYGRKCYEKLDEKWGKLYFEPVEGKKTFTLQRSCVLNEEDKEQERKDVLECWSIEENSRLADYDKLFTLMNKNIRGWWD